MTAFLILLVIALIVAWFAASAFWTIMTSIFGFFWSGFIIAFVAVVCLGAIFDGDKEDDQP
jgi:hypothetical protein